MSDNSLLNPLVERVTREPRELVIDFSELPALSILAHDILRCRLTGRLEGKHRINRANIVQSTIDDLTGENASFDSSDFKDSRISTSTFNQSTFRGAHINTSLVLDTRFTECRFTETSWNRSEFFRCAFVKCDFSNLLVKGCRFTDCLFEDCETTNKVFEGCLLLDCDFATTSLQVQTITDNFGLEASNVSPKRVRSGSPREGYDDLDFADLQPMVSEAERMALERFKLAYFLRDGIDDSYSELEAALDPIDWLRTCRIPGAFTSLLESFGEFLHGMFSHDKIVLHPILVFHSLTGRLLKELEAARSPSPHAAEVLRAISGVHLLNARLVERFLFLMRRISRDLSEGEVRLLVEGPIDANFYREEFPFAIRDDVRILSVTPRNSPAELLLSVLSMEGMIAVISLLLASRLSFELERLEVETRPEATESHANSPTVAGLLVSEGQADAPPKDPEKQHRGRKLLSLQAGRGREQHVLAELKLKALTPGNLLVEIGLDLSLEKIAKIRKVLHGILLRFTAPSEAPPRMGLASQKEENNCSE